MPLSTRFSRQEYWSGLPFSSPGDLPNPEIKPMSRALLVDSLPSESVLTSTLFLHNLVLLCHYFSSQLLRILQFLYPNPSDHSFYETMCRCPQNFRRESNWLSWARIPHSGLINYLQDIEGSPHACVDPPLFGGTLD